MMSGGPGDLREKFFQEVVVLDDNISVAVAELFRELGGN